MDLNIKRKERKVLNSSLYSSTHRNARTIKLVSLRVRRIRLAFIFCVYVRKDITPLRAKQVLHLTACCQLHCPLADTKRCCLTANEVASPMKCAYGTTMLPFGQTD